jgi:hypothetical protein
MIASAVAAAWPDQVLTVTAASNCPHVDLIAILFQSFFVVGQTIEILSVFLSPLIF